MSPTNRHKYKYFHSTVQRAKYRGQKFHFCRLPFDIRPRNFKLNLPINSNFTARETQDSPPLKRHGYKQSSKLSQLQTIKYLR